MNVIFYFNATEEIFLRNVIFLFRVNQTTYKVTDICQNPMYDFNSHVYNELCIYINLYYT